MICNGQIDMKTAQLEIARDWIAAYKKYVGPEPTASRGSSTRSVNEPAPETEPDSQANPSSGNDQVWVNTRSGVYWKQGTEYYGKTKEGKYMSEQDAIRQGYHLPGK